MTDGPTFAAIQREERLSDKVAAAITDSIMSGALAVGERLPAERTLCEQFGVSRPVVREAVRSLIARRLLTEHPRRGHVIAGVQSEAVSDSLKLVLRGHLVDYDQIGEIRAVLETETAALAAARATDAQLAAMLEALDEMQPGMEAVDAAHADFGFHRALAKATGNDIFVIVLDALRDALLEVQVPTLTPRRVGTARAAHKKIYDAVAAHDPDAARAAMEAHLTMGAKLLRESQQR